ncbi:MAG: carboxylating nicotinate-nucleotide diphosphorylase [Alphaproteobacteria bacterium]|jgi:nicotinate-nucleotide pyrophosphorylase (carboxylating)
MNITEIVKSAIREDIKDIGDITANSLLPENHKSQARIFAKQDGVCAGIKYAVETLKQFNLDFTVNKNDGDILNIGDTIITISGTTRNILTTERTILNFIGHLSGVATTTNKAVKIAKPHNVIIACTRKTTPGLRDAEKYAVKSGGGDTHRFGLYDAVMIKDNHLLAHPNIIEATKIVQQKQPNVKIEVEVDTIQQLEQVLNVNPDVILLDNMKPETVKKCVSINNTKTLLEASGNINLENLEQYCKTGVDIISMGWLTHSAKNLDVSLELTN